MLTEEQIQECQAKFNLSYHIYHIKGALIEKWYQVHRLIKPIYLPHIVVLSAVLWRIGIAPIFWYWVC